MPAKPLRSSSRLRISRGYAWALGALLVAAALVLAACGDDATPADASPGEPEATEAAETNGEATPAPAGGAQEEIAGEPDAVAFTQCMRDNGVQNFPDPQPSGGLLIPGEVAANPNLEAAQAACAHLQPTGQTAGGQVDPADMLEFAQCMRDNGVPDFPDPDPAAGGGGGAFQAGPAQGGGGFDPNSPAFQVALDVCGEAHGIQIMTPGGGN